MAVKTAKTKGTGTGAGTGTGWNKVADWLTSKGGKRSPSQVAIYYLGMIEERLRAP